MDWNFKAAFNILDYRRAGEVDHFDLREFLTKNGFDASDDELIAVMRRIEGGDGKLSFTEFETAISPTIIQMENIVEADDRKSFRQQQPQIPG